MATIDNTSVELTLPAQDSEHPEFQQARYRRFYDRLGDHFVFYSILVDSNEFIYLTSGFEKIFGLPISSALNKRWDEVINWLADSKEYIESQNRFFIQGQKDFERLELQFVHPSGKIKTVMASQYIAKDENSSFVIEGIIEDISKRIELEMTLEEMAFFDPLTKLFNRKAIDYAIDNELQRCERHGRTASVLFLDLDCFKKINDKYSHIAGDKTLEEFTRGLTKTIRSSDSAGRYGGEEFIVLLPETSLENAMELAERIRKQTADLHVDYNGESISFTTSIGVASFPDHAKSWEQLYFKVDQALYEAKHSGRNCIKAAKA